MERENSKRPSALRCLGMLLLSFAASLCVAGADDPAQDQPEPPVRLKKKVKPQPDQGPEKTADPKAKKRPELPTKPEQTKKDEEAQDKAEAEAREAEEKIQELVTRLAKNLHEAETRLAKKDPGDGTQQVQRDVVKDLQELIDQTKRQQQQQQQQQSSSSSSQQKSRQQARGNRTQRNQASAPRPQPGRDQQAQRGTRAQTSPRGEMSKIADLYKDIWGHLPETLRQDMNQYSREQFMAKYNELLKQYYATIAEKGRRKGD
jgi:hypothetical protein